MPENTTIFVPSPSDAGSVLLEEKIDALRQHFEELRNDIRFIKDIFVAKQAKKERRRQKKEQKRLAIEAEMKAKEDRLMKILLGK